MGLKQYETQPWVFGHTHIFTEQSLGSKIYEEEEMRPIMELVDKGDFYDVRADG